MEVLKMKRKCVKVISGDEFVIDKPIKGTFIVKLKGVGKGDIKRRKKLAGLIEGKVVTIEVLKITKR